MPELPEVNEPRRIRPLTIDQVDWSLFCKDRQTQERLRSLRKDEPLKFFDFSDCGVSLLEKVRQVKGGVKSLGGRPQFEMTNEVVEFLRQNRPQRMFYEPEDIPNLLQDQHELFVQHLQLGQILYWSIKFNPQYAKTWEREIARLDINRLDQSFFQKLLSHKPPYGFSERIFCPYLEVFYEADYEDGLVIFKPRFEASFPTSKTPEIIGEKLASHLGLPEKRVPSKLDFQVETPESLQISVSKG